MAPRSCWPTVWHTDAGSLSKSPRTYRRPAATFWRPWERSFRREPGAPLDNNLCERALKRAVLHRKNALFYRTLHGSEVGDLFMSLIHSCELAGANAFDSLSQLQRHNRGVFGNRELA